MRRTPQNENKKLVPLRRLAETSSYSFGYISILVQRKKLKAKKIGNKYYSTQEWFNEYLDLHARDSKRAPIAVEQPVAADLKNQINNLVEQAIIEKLEAPVSEPQEFVKWENMMPATWPDQVSEREVNQVKNLAEILDKELAPESETPKAVSETGATDLAAPENKLASAWADDLNQGEDKLASGIELTAGMIELEKAIAPTEKAIDDIKPSASFKFKKLLSLAFKTSATGLIATLCLIGLIQFAPEELELRKAQAAFLNSAQAFKSNLARAFKFNSAREFQYSLAGVLESRSAKVVADLGQSIDQASSGWQFALLQAKHIADNILPDEYLEPMSQFKNKVFTLAGLGEYASKDSVGRVAGETEIAAALPTSSNLTPAANQTTPLAAVQINQPVSTTARQMEILALLTDKQGKIADGEYDVRFALYNKNRTTADAYPSNTDQNNKVWEETQKVTVKNGGLRTFLGKTKDLPLLTLLATDQFYLGIRIADDSEMTPRKKMPAPFYALNAINAGQLNGRIVGNKAGNIPALNNTGKNIGRLDYSLMPTEVTDFISRFTGGSSDQPSGDTTALTAGVISTDFGGTGLSTYAKGDLLYYNSGKTLTKLPIGSDGQVLSIVNGVPTWSSSKGSTIILGGGGSVASIKSTSDLPEGTNLYWTDGRFDARFNTSIAATGVWTLNGSDAYRSTGNVGIGTSSPSAKLTVWGSGSGANQLINFVNSASTTLFTVLENGNIGIGTSTPAYPLDVQGDIRIAGSGKLYFADGTSLYTAGLGDAGSVSSSGDAIVTADRLNTGTGNVILKTGVNDRLTVLNNGNVGIGTSTAYAKLTVWGTGSSTNQLIDFVNSASSSLLTILENGNVGIGTTSPVDTLAVNGPIFLADISPATTTNRLYANGGDLYYAGNLIGGATTGNWSTDGVNVWRTGGNVGIGTTSPYARLAVAGQIVGEYFTATSTTATSTFPYLSVTSNSSLGTIIGGTWQADTIGVPYGGTGQTSFTSGNLLMAQVLTACRMWPRPPPP